MTILDVKSFAHGEWITPGSDARDIEHAVTGDVFARAGNDQLDVAAMLDYARSIGGRNLRKHTFHDRARMLKALAIHLGEHKQALYDISFASGATLKDHKIDIDGGIGTMFVFASKGRREMPDSQIYLDGDVEQLSRNRTFLGHHVYTPMQGAAIHINAFNFPVWGMLEKLAPTLLAGVPAIVKPATATCYVTELAVKIMLDSGLLPKGALQLVSGGIGNMLDLLTCQDTVGFTGSAQTAFSLRSSPHILKNSIQFVAEQDSLNATILGPDATPESAEFNIFIKEAHREMTAKAGQKCTAIRRIIAPDPHIDAVIDALSERLSHTIVGDPTRNDVHMGALVSSNQKSDVLEKASILSEEAELVFGDMNPFDATDVDLQRGAFLSPLLFHCQRPDTAERVHDTEAFGPVSTIMGYRDVAHAIELANRGQGSLVASVVTRDTEVAREIVMGAGAFHGRLYFNNRDSEKELSN